MTNGRNRSDSITAQVAAHQKDSVFEWPEHFALPDDEEKARVALTLADEVWASRAPEDWRPSDPSLIAEYAIVSADLQAVQLTLTNSGYFTRGYGRGGQSTVTQSPVMDVAHRLSSRRAKLAGVLSLTSTAGLGDPRTIANNGAMWRAENPRINPRGIEDPQEVELPAAIAHLVGGKGDE